MKMHKVIGALMVLLVSTSVNSAVIYWEPTNADVNFIYPLKDGYTLGLFDVDDFDGVQANPLLLTTNYHVDTVTFQSAGSDYTATSNVTSNSITLFGDAQYVLALTDGSNWFEPTSWQEFAPNSNVYKISFLGSARFMGSIDAVPMVVPVPASIWLLGSGLLGLIAVARRKAL